MYTRFEIFRDVSGLYRWRLVASNNEIVAVSESYHSKQAAINTAKRIRLLSQTAKMVDRTLPVSQFIA